MYYTYKLYEQYSTKIVKRLIKSIEKQKKKKKNLSSTTLNLKIKPCR